MGCNLPARTSGVRCGRPGLDSLRAEAVLGDSSTVEQRTLTPLILVRIQVPQPTSLVSPFRFPGVKEVATFPLVRSWWRSLLHAGGPRREPNRREHQSLCGDKRHVLGIGIHISTFAEMGPPSLFWSVWFSRPKARPERSSTASIARPWRHWPIQECVCGSPNLGLRPRFDNGRDPVRCIGIHWAKDTDFGTYRRSIFGMPAARLNGILPGCERTESTKNPITSPDARNWRWPRRSGCRWRRQQAGR